MAREDDTHAPGHAIQEGGMRQRAMMGGGAGGVHASDFGVDPLPGTKRDRGMHANLAIDDKLLSDRERSCRPGLKVGDDMMRAQAHGDHGPHR